MSFDLFDFITYWFYILSDIAFFTIKYVNEQLLLGSFKMYSYILTIDKRTRRLFQMKEILRSQQNSYVVYRIRNFLRIHFQSSYHYNRLIKQ